MKRSVVEAKRLVRVPFFKSIHRPNHVKVSLLACHVMRGPTIVVRLFEVSPRPVARSKITALAGSPA